MSKLTDRIVALDGLLSVEGYSRLYENEEKVLKGLLESLAKKYLHKTKLRRRRFEYERGRLVRKLAGTQTFMDVMIEDMEDMQRRVRQAFAKSWAENEFLYDDY